MSSKNSKKETKEWIRFGHFKRLMTTQPFFVWNPEKWVKLRNSKGSEYLEHSEELLWHLDQIKLITEENIPSSKLYSRAYFYVFQHTTKKLYDFVEEQARSQNKRITTIGGGKIEERLALTKKALEDENIDFIIDPIFAFKECLSSIIYLDKVEKQAAIMNLSSSTKRNNLLQIYWNWQILEHSIPEFGLKEITQVMIDNYSQLKRGEIKFTENPYVNETIGFPNMSPASIASYKEKGYKDVGFITENSLKKQGLWTRKNVMSGLDIVKNYFSPYEQEGETFEEHTRRRANDFGKKATSIAPHLKEKLKEVLDWELLGNYHLRDYLKEYKFLEYKSKKMVFQPFETYRRLILLAKKEKEMKRIVSTDLRYFRGEHGPISVIRYFEKDVARYSGLLLPTETKVEITEAPKFLDFLVKNRITTIFFHSYVWRLCQRPKGTVFYNAYYIEEFLKMINKAKKILWFDFEGLGLPSASLDKAMPFQQVITQLSYIITSAPSKKEPEIVKNFIFDPQKITWRDQAKVIDLLYEPQAQFYVVFNRRYEESRLKEAVDLIFRNTLDFPLLEEYRQKVDFISQRIIDLQDFFSAKKIKSESEWRMPLVFIPHLRGKFGIKALEDFIASHRYQLTESTITPYKKLTIQNGVMAMEVAAKRAIGKIGDRQWRKVTKSLKEYCENDVRAMLLVYNLLCLLVTCTNQIDRDPYVWEHVCL